MKPLEPLDLVALILASSIAVVVVSAALVPAFTGRTLSEGKVALVADLCKQILVLLVAFVTYKMGKGKK